MRVDDNWNVRRQSYYLPQLLAERSMFSPRHAPVCQITARATPHQQRAALLPWHSGAPSTGRFMLANHPDREQIRLENLLNALGNPLRLAVVRALAAGHERDRKSTRLNSSHSQISYAVFCLKKKKGHRKPYCNKERPTSL